MMFGAEVGLEGWCVWSMLCIVDIETLSHPKSVLVADKHPLLVLIGIRRDCAGFNYI